MARLPVVSGEELIRILLRAGFPVVRQKGSHVSLENGTYLAVVSLHDELAKGTLLGILKQCGLTKDDLTKLIGQ